MMPVAQSTFALILIVITDKEITSCLLAGVIYGIVMKDELIGGDGRSEVLCSFKVLMKINSNNNNNNILTT